MHGPGASNSGGAGGEAKWKNTEILTSEGGPAPPGPPIVGNPVVIMSVSPRTGIVCRRCLNGRLIWEDGWKRTLGWRWHTRLQRYLPIHYVRQIFPKQTHPRINHKYCRVHSLIMKTHRRTNRANSEWSRGRGEKEMWEPEIRKVAIAIKALKDNSRAIGMDDQ